MAALEGKDCENVLSCLARCVQVRQIKSLESQLKWGLQREERRQTEEERREEAGGKDGKTEDATHDAANATAAGPFGPQEALP